MDLPSLRRLGRRCLWALGLLPFTLATAQTLSPDFSPAGLGTSVIPDPQPGMTYGAQNGALSLAYRVLIPTAPTGGGSAQWTQPLSGDFIFRATVDISGLQVVNPPFIFANAGAVLSFASGANVAIAPWRDGAGASVNGGYTAPAYVGGTTYVTSPSPVMDIVMERRGTTITQWAGEAGSGNLQPLMTVTSADFSGPATGSFYLYVQHGFLLFEAQATAVFSNVSVTPVPEPASVLLMTLGLLMLARRARAGR